jgi:hypothetical protein
MLKIILDGQPCMMHLSRGNPDCVKLLLESQADKNAKDEDGNTALDLAKWGREGVLKNKKKSDYLECVKLLEESPEF